jgi:hypothetical protein
VTWLDESVNDASGISTISSFTYCSDGRVPIETPSRVADPEVKCE